MLFHFCTFCSPELLILSKNHSPERKRRENEMQWWMLVCRTSHETTCKAKDFLLEQGGLFIICLMCLPLGYHYISNISQLSRSTW